MRRLRARKLGAALALAIAALAAIAGPSHAVAITAGTGSGLAGQTVDIDISTASMTGLNVLSLQMSLSYTNTVVTAVDVLTSGTMVSAAGWAVPAFNVTNVGGTGKITIADAGTTALSGAGVLLRVRFTLNPALINGSSTGLTLSNVLLNEGTPPATVTSGSITIGVTPQINVSPDVGEVIRGQTLAFSVSGSVTTPVAWTTTDNAIATIAPSGALGGLLTGVAPGAVYVTATDALLHASTTDNAILIRGMGLTVGAGSVQQGQSVQVPITVTSLSGLGIRAGQFHLSWSGSFVTATGVSTPGGTLLNGWGSTTFGGSSNDCTVDFAGTTDLLGSGILCYVTFAGSPSATGSSGLVVTNAIFNETMPAKTTNGTITVTTLPPINVIPDQVTLLAGQTQQMSLGGSPTPPITWSVLDGTVASISGTGLLTALHGGVTQVRAQDNLGSLDLNAFVRVYDLKATLGTVTTRPGMTVRVPLVSDRFVGPLNIHSEQLQVTWFGTSISAAHAVSSALWGEWGPGSIIAVAGANSITAAAAGAAILDNAGLDLAALEFDISPLATPGTNVALTVAQYLCNEGDPSPQVVNGLIQIRNTAGVGDDEPAAFALGAGEPNPLVGSCRIPFTLPRAGEGGARVTLAIYALDGRRVRTLVDGPLPAGPHEAVWDGRDEAGARVGAGLYFARLACGGLASSRKLSVMH